MELNQKDKTLIQYADEYEGRDGLSKLPYKLLLKQSEIRNGQLLSEIDELKDTIATLQSMISDQQQKIKEMETENAKQVLKKANTEIASEHRYRLLQNRVARLLSKIKSLRESNNKFVHWKIIATNETENNLLHLLREYLQRQPRLRYLHRFSAGVIVSG